MSIQAHTAGDFYQLPRQQGRISPEAQADVERYGPYVAIYNEWQRAHFQPAIHRLKQRLSVVDGRQVREVLVLSQEWALFESVAMRHLKLTPNLRAHLLSTTKKLLDMVGKYWGNYYAAVERRSPKELQNSPYLLRDPVLEGLVKDWFKKVKIDRRALRDGIVNSSAERGQRYWDIFRAGLLRKLTATERAKLRQPTQRFREIPDWKARFQLMARSFQADVEMAPFIVDPITLGGAIAYRNSAAFYTDGRSNQLQYMVDCIYEILDHILTWLGMAESCGEEAICAFLEVHNL
uniref:Uncharacterized protein n=1 Tax=Schizophyllum commune (strain H4-8 / FGSC 9210) TaxID=578458 RepID=D8PMD4_SCHCM